MTGLATKRNARVSEVQVLVMGMEGNSSVARQIDALPEPDKMRHPIDQTDLRPLDSLGLASGIAAKPTKAEVCHVNGANESYERSEGILTITLIPGKIISIPEQALDSHLRHGDEVYPDFLYLSEGDRVELAEEGIHIPNANCLNYEIKLEF